MKIIAIIPARYGSSRFPGKPLAKLGGREVILRVCDRVSEAGLLLAVATDDERIRKAVESAGYTAVMTRADHKSGTDRIREAIEKIGGDYDTVINIQGDEPFIESRHILALADIFRKEPETELATLCRKFDKADGFDALFDPNVVKVVKSNRGEALYFTRSVVPYVRGAECNSWLDMTDYFTHIGIYGYKVDTLREITELPQSALEKAESLEQLRWLENGYKVRIAETDYHAVGIDTEEDLRKAETLLDNNL